MAIHILHSKWNLICCENEISLQKYLYVQNLVRGYLSTPPFRVRHLPLRRPWFPLEQLNNDGLSSRFSRPISSISSHSTQQKYEESPFGHQGEADSGPAVR